MFGSRIKLDKDLLDRCREYAKEAGYTSLEEFIEHALEKELRNAEGDDTDSNDKLRKRLRGLGYIE